jgi:hypothetical protein
MRWNAVGRSVLAREGVPAEAAYPIATEGPKLLCECLQELIFYYLLNRGKFKIWNIKIFFSTD